MFFVGRKERERRTSLMLDVQRRGIEDRKETAGYVARATRRDEDTVVDECNEDAARIFFFVAPDASWESRV